LSRSRKAWRIPSSKSWELPSRKALKRSNLKRVPHLALRLSTMWGRKIKPQQKHLFKRDLTPWVEAQAMAKMGTVAVVVAVASKA